MRLRWTARAFADLDRLHAFLAHKNRPAADRAIEALRAAPAPLLDFPRMGSRIGSIGQKDVRRLLAGQYELRYRIVGDVVEVVRVFHTREDR